MSFHVPTVIWRYTLHLQWAVAENLYIGYTAVLHMYPPWVSCCYPFLYIQQWTGNEQTWPSLENLFMSFSEVELVLFSICNKYSNIVNMLHKWLVLFLKLLFFFKILQYFYMHCCVSSRHGADFSLFVKKKIHIHKLFSGLIWKVHVWKH